MRLAKKNLVAGVWSYPKLTPLFFKEFFRFFAMAVTFQSKSVKSQKKIETRGRKPLSKLVRFKRWKARKRYEWQRYYRQRTVVGDKLIHAALRSLHLTRGKGRPHKVKQPVLVPKILVPKIFVPLPAKPSWLTTAKKYKHSMVSVLFTIAVVALAGAGYWYVFVDLPSALDLTRKEQALTTRILDRNGQLLYRIYDDENRTLVPLSRVSPYLIQATLAIEDRDFYRHHGFSIKGILRAGLANVQGDEIAQGGSTITQQLVKNRLLSPQRTWQRKLRELVLAVIVEGVYTKEEILEMYLNQVAYGGSTYGVEEASWRYFNKSAKDLDLAESALLAGLPAAPSVYTPFGPNPELAYARQEEVFRRMVEDGMITPEQVTAAKAEKLTFNTNTIDIKAPHFVMYLRQLLAQQYGEEVLTKGGLEVRTTLDLDVQAETQKLVTDEMKLLAKLRISNGAALVTNPQTGEILAMVGSKNYFDFDHDGQVNVILRPRQPGSSIKPFTYALALQQGKSPASMILDAPVAFQSAGSPTYSPKNYDGKYHGLVSLRESLGSSYNIPAVKTLNEVGINNFIDFAEKLGITTWQDRSRFGLSLTLGGGEVRMIDLAQAYSAFPNGGYPVPPNAILEIRNHRGELLYHNQCAMDGVDCKATEPVISPLVAYQITDILADNKARTPAFGPVSVLNIPGQQVAVKTGTTNSMRDNWTVGYTTNRLVAVWVGNNDNTPMSYVASGITGASPIWNKIMRSMLDEKLAHRFELPTGLVKVAICAKTGTLPCTGCPNVREEVFAAGAEPKKACNPQAFVSPAPGQPQPQPGQSATTQTPFTDVAIRRPVVRGL
jgi:1A family penicillin-binding protein